MLLQLRSDDGLWGMPGGSLEPGESLQGAALGELLKRGFLTETSVDKKTVRYQIGKSFVDHHVTLELRGTLGTSVASRQTFTWLNALYLRIFRSHLQV